MHTKSTSKSMTFNTNTVQVQTVILILFLHLLEVRQLPIPRNNLLSFLVEHFYQTHTTWWIINKIKTNLRWTLKHPHYILHTTRTHFKQTPRQWFRLLKLLPEGELYVSAVSPQRLLCFQHPYIRSQGRATSVLPNISVSPFSALWNKGMEPAQLLLRQRAPRVIGVRGLEE